MSHIFIVGGISVNDKDDHDLFPYNFINPAVRRAKQYVKDGVSASDVTIAMYTPSYETRALKQKKEHSTVQVSQLPCASWNFLCKKGVTAKPKNKEHFRDVARNASHAAGFTFLELRSAGDLTDLLKKTKPIASIHYFGHSNAASMFLEYSRDGRGKGTVTWGEAEAKNVPKSNFASDAIFVSYGCNQADSGGLVAQLHKLWGVTTIGSRGKTDYGPIGQGHAVPDSNGSYVRHDGAGQKDIEAASIP